MAIEMGFTEKQGDPLPALISDDERRDILSRVSAWLLTIYRYKTSAAYICEGTDPACVSFRIMASRKKYDIYLRFGQTWVSEGVKSIVIARIGFERRKKGHGTALLKTLVSIARDHDYSYLAIESVNDNSEAFAKALGFEPHMLPRCYVIPTETLCTALMRRDSEGNMSHLDKKNVVHCGGGKDLPLRTEGFGSATSTAGASGPQEVDPATRGD